MTTLLIPSNLKTTRQFAGWFLCSYAPLFRRGIHNEFGSGVAG